MQNEDSALNSAMLAALEKMNAALPALAEAAKSGPSAPAEARDAVATLCLKVDSLLAALSQARETRISVSVEGADGAIHDLVGRVLEEALVRVRQENILAVTNL